MDILKIHFFDIIQYMNEGAVQFVQNQLSLASSRLKSQAANPKGKPYPKRHIFARLQKYIENFTAEASEHRWILLPGLRGIGKTTVLSQLFLELLPTTDSIRVLYVSLDEASLLDIKLIDILQAYEQILGEPLERLKAPIYLFFDEVQYDPKWGITLKTLFDRTKKAFVCCTGSSSVALQTNPDVRRRVIVEKLFPLSFPEFQLITNEISPPKGLKQKIRNAMYFSNNSTDAYEQFSEVRSSVLQYWSKVNKLEIQKYLTRGTLPFALGLENISNLFGAINDLLDKIVMKDIQNIKSFDQQTLQSIKRLLFVLADSNGNLSVAKLTSSTGLQSKITVQNVLDALEQSELLIRIPPYGSSKSKVTKPSKYLFMSPTVRMALLGITGKKSTFDANMGKFMEDAAAVHLKRELVALGLGSVTHDPKEGGADFIVQVENKRQVVIEIGIGDKGNRQAKHTLERIDGDYRITICDTELSIIKEKRLIRLPLDFFLLM